MYTVWLYGKVQAVHRSLFYLILVDCPSSFDVFSYKFLEYRNKKHKQLQATVGLHIVFTVQGSDKLTSVMTRHERTR